ncbi:MAG: CRISPR-associated endonuclease Cas2 [Acidimicrobiales bacterium]
MDVLVTYDIQTVTPAGEQRLAKVAKTCERYGTRVQFSVFECRLTEAAFLRLRADLEAILDRKVDSINLYRFGGTLSGARTSLGRRPAHEPGSPWLL